MWLADKPSAFVVCLLLETDPENMDDGRPGNLPPPDGGISSTGRR
jgi:hypothetical protein